MKQTQRGEYHMICSDDLVFDLGLHKGEDTDFYLRKGYRVVAFEANPTLINECSEKFSSFVASGQLTIVGGAIAPASYGERITFYVSSCSVWGTVHSDWDARNSRLGAISEKIETNRVDFADTLRRYGMPLYLKIDVEGVDRHVLDALKEFSTPPQHISVESEKVNFGNLMAELECLRELGYSKFRAVQQQNNAGMKLRTKDLEGREFEYVFSEHSSGPFGDDLDLQWKRFDDVVKDYKEIFRAYRFFGDNSLIRSFRLGGHIIAKLESSMGRPLSGWYDTHATR